MKKKNNMSKNNQPTRKFHIWAAPFENYPETGFYLVNEATRENPQEYFRMKKSEATAHTFEEALATVNRFKARYPYLFREPEQTQNEANAVEHIDKLLNRSSVTRIKTTSV